MVTRRLANSIIAEMGTLQPSHAKGPNALNDKAKPKKFLYTFLSVLIPHASVVK
jgi:hypothetical protein